MRGKLASIITRWHRDNHGPTMVEFAFCLFLFLVLVFGIIDLGHAFYMRHMVTNASREGARYGISYREDAGGNRVAPINLNPSIEIYLLNGCLSKASFPEDANPAVTVSGAGCTTGNCGAPLEVTVSAVKTWFVLDNFVPGLGEQTTVTSTTIMRCE